VGLLLFGRKHIQEHTSPVRMNKGFKSVLERMKSWFQGNF